MVKIVRLRTRKEAAEQAVLSQAAELLRQLPPDQLGQLLDMDRFATSRATRALHRHGRPDIPGGTWPGGFVMLSRNQTEVVWNAIRKLPAKDRPIQVRDAFILLMLNIRQDTGECVLTRHEIAERIGCTPNAVSQIMSTLERMGVLRRELTRVEGMRGRGVVTYVVNAHVAWNGSLDVRKEEAAAVAPPLLTLMQGGAEQVPSPVASPDADGLTHPDPAPGAAPGVPPVGRIADVPPEPTPTGAPSPGAEVRAAEGTAKRRAAALTERGRR